MDLKEIQIPMDALHSRIQSWMEFAKDSTMLQWTPQEL